MTAFARDPRVGAIEADDQRRDQEGGRDQLESALPRLIERYSPTAIYVSLPPFSMGPLWIDLARRFKLPIVMDFRDAVALGGGAGVGRVA